MKKFTLLFFTLVFSTSILAQRLKQFSSEKEGYLADMREFLTKETDADKKDVIEPLLFDFAAVWQTEAVAPAEVKEIVQISNNLLRKRVTQFVAWRDFLKVIIHLENNEDEKLTLPWLEDLRKLSDEKPGRFSSDYLQVSRLLFYENIFYDDGRIRWKAENGDYEFDFDGEPIFTFEMLDVWGYFKDDSTLIEATAGTFYPRQNLFKGDGGFVYFTRAGLSEDSANVELSNYYIQTDKSDFEADSVILTTELFFKEPVLGSFQEKLTSQGGRKGTFPRFASYRKDLVVKNIVKGANYSGGFSMLGSRFYGSGTPEKKANIQFTYEGKEVMKVQAERFLLREDKVESEEAEVTLRLEEDSVYHPKVTMRFLPEIRQVNIIRFNEGLGQSSFSNTYHDLDMMFERLTWKIDEPQMYIGNINLGAESPVFFESKNYFRGERYAAIGGLDLENPLVRLKRMGDAYGDRFIAIEDVARFMRMDVQNAHIFMLNMYVMGFVDYDVNSRQAQVSDKTFEYVLNNKKERDYDVIRFVSNLSQGSNARLSLLNYDMEITGIRAIALSDSQQVGLFPTGGKITVHKDLNFDFDGRISAGRFSYWGELFKFNYDQFRINMDEIDSMRFKVESFKENNLGRRELVNVKTVLQGLTGELLIDDPRNKSGAQDLPQYPIFKSAKNSYVYYDKKSIHGGAYNREEFYVELEPFEIDSLDKSSTQGIKFAGRFTSAGIFPDLQQTLTVQEDYSLGFTTLTPENGLAAYGGKGTFTNQISLSNKGLRGKGRIDYLNSVANSDEFLFFPDSTNGLAKDYEITESGLTPHVLGTNVNLHWEPKNDVLYTTSKKESPFAMYDNVGMRATGTLAHSPSDLRGKGLLEFLNAETRSKDYLFEKRKFSSDELAFQVRANVDSDWGFSMKNANGKVDFDKQKGDFYLNDPADYFSFPANKYICYMDYALWQIPQKAVSVEKTGSQSSSKMVSTLAEQDSLQFVADRTKFFLESSLLESFDVPNIDVADASIFPDTGYVAIEKNAKMRTLNNAAITANRTTKFHEFYGSVVDIQGRKSYTALGDYEYLDKDGTPWPVRFHEIKVDPKTLTTLGKARVEKSEDFYMSPYFAYFGNVGLEADRKALAFRGETHIDANCPSISTDWFAFESILDPDNIVINLPEVDPDDKTKTLANGVYLASDSIASYAAFLSKNVSPADKQMFFANGKLFFDEEIGGYVITTAERMKNENARGNYLTLNTIECTLYGEGEMSIGDGQSQLEVNTWGAIDYDLNTDDLLMDLVLGLDFPFNDKIAELMANRINKETLLEGTDFSRPAFKTAVNEELKEKDRKEFNQDIEDYGAPDELPDELQHTLLFSDLVLQWSPESISFLSDGKIGLGGADKYLVNKMLGGYFELQRKRRGDELYIYLEPDRSTFYYIEYKRNIMSMYSNDEAVMTVIKEMDLKDRRNDVKGKPVFTYTIGTKGKMNRFLTQMEKFE